MNIKLNKKITKIALKDFLTKHWKKITAFLLGYIIAIIDPTFINQFKIILENLTVVSGAVFWGTYIATIIFTYFLLRIYIRIFARPSLDINQQKSIWSKIFALYIIFCMGFFVGVIVDILVAYVNVSFEIYLNK